MRWGILWRTLQFDLVKCQQVVQVCLLLHNHIKDEDQRDNADDFNDDFNWTSAENSATGIERAFPLVADNNERYVGGRPSIAQENARARGETIRRSIAVLLQLQGLRRPLHSGMRYNEYGHVFFDG